MYCEVKTTDHQQIIDKFIEKLSSETPVSFTVYKRGDLYCADILDLTDEPEMFDEPVTS